MEKLNLKNLSLVTTLKGIAVSLMLKVVVGKRLRCLMNLNRTCISTAKLTWDVCLLDYVKSLGHRSVMLESRHMHNFSNKNYS